jgi:hypothetical protein
MAINVTSEVEQYSDFSIETGFSNFQLKIDDKRLFINAHYIAELSPVFAAMFFNEGFKEMKEQIARIKEDKFEDILEMFRCLLPCSSVKKRSKPITLYNFPVLVKLADKYEIEILKTYCENFILEDFKCDTSENGKLIDILQSAANFGLSKQSLAILIERAVEIDIQTLKASKLIDTIPAKIIGALFITKYEHDMSQIQCNHKHNWVSPALTTVQTYCSVANCYYSGPHSGPPTYCFRCAKCARYFCADHGANPPADCAASAKGDKNKPKVDMTMLE